MKLEPLGQSILLTSVAIRIRIPIRDSNRHQNLIFCSLSHCKASLKISCKSVQRFLRKVANRQTDKRRLHIVVGRGNNLSHLWTWYSITSLRLSFLLISPCLQWIITPCHSGLIFRLVISGYKIYSLKIFIAYYDS